MERRDLLKDEIERFARALAKILFDFLGLKSKGQATQGIEISNQRLQDELDIEVEKLMMLTKAGLRDYLKNRKLTAEHIEILSEYLMEIGIEEMKINKDKIRLKKAIELLDIADEMSKTMSLDRINKKTKIENILQQEV